MVGRQHCGNASGMQASSGSVAEQQNLKCRMVELALLENPVWTCRKESLRTLVLRIDPNLKRGTIIYR